jgi:hypothetical protein
MAALGIRAKALRFIAAGGIAAAVMLPGAAMAQTCTYGTGTCQGKSGIDGPGSTQDAKSSGATSDGGSLPFTGGDVVGLALIGVGAVAGGTALARSGRRRHVDA